jgi:cytochrome c oxidase cbb3-type subunit III
MPSIGIDFPVQMKRTITYLFLFACVLAMAHLAAQEPEPGAPAGRGGRGGRGRGRGGAQSTREFLGLGPAPDAAAAKLGEPLYKENCATCHGDTARGAQGPNLVRSVVVLHDEKGNEIGQVIKQGRPQGGMPAFPTLKDDQIYDIAEYLHLQVELAANRGSYGQTYANLRTEATGDATKGKAYFDAHCTECHSATGDLAHIAEKFGQATTMQARFLWPASRGPQRAVVTTADGKTYSGVVREKDDFGVSLVDSAGEYHYWPADKVQVKVEDKLGGHRALLPKYTDADIHNVTAYLLTLK